MFASSLISPGIARGFRYAARHGLALVLGVMLQAADAIAEPARSAAVIETDPAAAAAFIEQHPDRFALILVSTPGCGYCEQIRRSQLAPLLRDRDDEDGLAIFEIDLQDSRTLEPGIERFTRFDGIELNGIRSAGEFSARLGIRVAPTLLFVGGRRELSERLVGYGNPDFYWAYLSERMTSAKQSLAQSSRIMRQ